MFSGGTEIFTLTKLETAYFESFIEETIFMNLIREIEQFNRNRDAHRLGLKYAAMRRDPLTFLRGTCHLFYDRLPKEAAFGSAPVVWSCGDLHFENFGSYKGNDGQVYFDINDFDEASLLPAAIDLLRLATSIVVICNQNANIGNASIRILINTLISAYRLTLSQGKALWFTPVTSQGEIHDLLLQAIDRKRVDFLDRRTRIVRGKRRLRHDTKRYLPVTEQENQNVRQCLDTFASTQPNPDFYQVLDVANRVAGTGSLGLERYAVLIEGNGSKDRNHLLDLKAAVPSIAASRWPDLQPQWPSEAERICRTQFQMQAVSMAFLHPIIWDQKPYILRALQPTEDRLALPGRDTSIDALMVTMKGLGQCLASAQLRSSGRRGSATADALIAFASKRKWSNRLTDLACVMAAQVHTDWNAYSAAFDRGDFNA